MSGATSARPRVWGILFVCTGCTALLAEQSFEKLLSTLLGASTPAAATVLAVYFGGLTLGGILFARWGRSRPIQPIRLYALLELCVGLWAFLLYLTFDKLIPLFAPLLALGLDRFWLLQCLRVLVAACWILPATVPMGASFPAMVDSLEQLDTLEHGKTTARFYSLNLVGAIAGALAGPFLIFPLWGVDGGLLFAACVNLLVALVAYSTARGLASVRPTPKQRKISGESPGSPRLRLILMIAFVSGFLFFALEVLWTHLIGAVLGNSVYAFAAMLAVVLVGLALGGACTVARLPAGQLISVSDFSKLLLGAALVLGLLSVFWPDVPRTIATLGVRVETFGTAELLRWLMAAAMVLLPATLLGMVYPTLFRLDIFPAQNAGAVVGRMVAANSVGCVLGALATGFVLIPWLGSEMTLRLLTAGCAFGGIVIWLTYRPREQRTRLAILSLATVAVVTLQPRWNRLHLTSGLHVYFRFAEVGPATILKFFHEDTRGGITTVVDNTADSEHGPQSYRTLLTNGKFQGNDGREMEAQTGFALVPMLFVSRFDDALVIGLGTGHSAQIVDAMGFATIDVAETAPGIVQAAREYFGHVNGAVLDKPHVRLLLEDGRNLLLLRDRQYDLITMEISSVWFAGATNLYSEEFYRLARRRLKQGGIFQQWIQIHHIGTEELLTAIATVRHVFPQVSFWVVGGQGILVGSLTPQIIEPPFLRALAHHVTDIGWIEGELSNRLAALVSSRLLSPEDVTALVQQRSIILNTDRNRRLEYFAPRYNYSPVDYRTQNVRALVQFASFPPPAVAADASGHLAEICRHIEREKYWQRFGRDRTR